MLTVSLSLLPFSMKVYDINMRTKVCFQFLGPSDNQEPLSFIYQVIVIM